MLLEMATVTGTTVSMPVIAYYKVNPGVPACPTVAYYLVKQNVGFMEDAAILPVSRLGQREFHTWKNLRVQCPQKT